MWFLGYVLKGRSQSLPLHSFFLLGVWRCLWWLWLQNYLGPQNRSHALRMAEHWVKEKGCWVTMELPSEPHIAYLQAWFYLLTFNQLLVYVFLYQRAEPNPFDSPSHFCAAHVPKENWLPSWTLGVSFFYLFNPILLAHDWCKNGHAAHSGPMRLEENFVGVSGKFLCFSGRAPWSSNPVSLRLGIFVHGCRG